MASVGFAFRLPTNQLPISPPSSFVMTRHAERGRPPSSPSGQELSLGIRRVAAHVGGTRQVRRLTRVLAPHEHRLLVGGHEHAGDLALLRPGQKPADLAGRRIGAQHLVVAEPGVVAGV